MRLSRFVIGVRMISLTLKASFCICQAVRSYLLRSSAPQWDDTKIHKVVKYWWSIFSNSIFKDQPQVWKWKWKWQRVERGRVWRQEQVQSRVPAQCEKVLEGKNGKTSWILKEQYTDLVDRAAVPGLRLHPHRQRPPRRQGKAVGEDLATFWSS